MSCSFRDYAHSEIPGNACDCVRGKVVRRISFFFRIGRMGLVCNALRICFSNRSREVWFWVAMCSILPNWLFGLCFLESDICGAGFGFGCPFVCDCWDSWAFCAFLVLFCHISYVLDKAKGLESLDSSPFRPVRAGGVEPPRAYTHCHLKTARLPFRHARRQSTNLHLYYLWHKSACRTAVFAKRMHKAVRREEGGGPVDLQTMEPSFVQKAAFA